MLPLADSSMRLPANAVDYLFLGIYFVFVLGVGLISKRSISSSLDFFLSGRSLPAWVTGLAFISANMGALEILGMAANGAQYGMPTTHYYWIGAIPALIFLGLFMMPFYYGSKVRSVPEFLRRRFNKQTQLFQAVMFSIATVLIAGVNLYALAVLVQALLGWPLWISIVFSGLVVLAYTTLGGLNAAIYNEVLQFFVIIAALVPLTVIGLTKIGGWDGFVSNVENSRLGEQAMHAWQGTGLENTTNALGNWIAIVFGLGFMASFGYFTTNFAEVQRSLSANSMSAAKRTPIIAGFVKMCLPVIVVVPGMIAAVTIPQVGTPGEMTYNDALPALIGQLMPNGLLGVAMAALLASFMAGMAANISSFNTVFINDLWQPYIRKGRSDHYYLQAGRVVTIIGVLIAILTAFIAAGYTNLFDYWLALNSVFNGPLFVTFLIGLLWKRMTPWAGFFSLVLGTITAVTVVILHKTELVHFQGDQAAALWGGTCTLIVGTVVAVAVTLVTKPKPDSELRGLVWKLTPKKDRAHETSGSDRGWYRSPALLAGVCASITVALTVFIG
ncbi:sodium:solute symporter family protein [Saccharopolyspora sp. S2-29]|uniref:Sodium:solute symporter family protein n=2 Tax=Saccharopolyspora mangrovi TaxID=3082379 RepID=A0ABU6AIH2_9PSEU|nr:sodium:solute symporter family protein [Saccharopolyspora sp. S2-29]MEB3371267.1 sodium:solute symporter family protein [Saccharopolyspora sp. S2-29]